MYVYVSDVVMYTAWDRVFIFRRVTEQSGQARARGLYVSVFRVYRQKAVQKGRAGPETERKRELGTGLFG